ncbi:DUF3000 domain-containing protein [Cryobacterium lactosi]|uniref:DUF3000 domain-containing protein n=1 Tax=Cryobacterium lactosi TaxID=1259202 RepID=A0A4R9BZ47_9MICO|nr:DUF3000 domain-containing protein [Cryobacterium lactosi]
MPDSEDQPQRPAQFAAALDAIRSSSPRPELVVTEISAPGNLAPYAVALSADVTPVRHGSDSEFGTGRFILLYDPEEPDSWGGPFRVVCFAQAPLETDIGIDPFLADVAWAWLVDALDARGANYTAASGTATKILSSGFGELAHQGDGAQIELRASWSPLDNDLAAHVEGWAELLCMLAGLPPAGELPVPPRHGHPSQASPSRHGQAHDTADHETHGNSSPERRGPGHDSSEPGASAHSASGIMLGAVEPIGPAAASMRRTGPGLHTLGVAVGIGEPGGRDTVGVDIAGLDSSGAERAGRETAGMSAMAVNSVGADLGHSGPLGIHPNVLSTPAPTSLGVTDLSAHRAARG